MIITCNHLKGIHVPNERERRYFIIHCNDCYIGKHDYFNELNKVLDNRDNMNIFFSYLYDYEDIVELHPIPITKIKKEMIEDSMPYWDKFLFHRTIRFMFNVEENIKTCDLYDLFKKWFDDRGFNSKRPSMDSFSKSIKSFGKSEPKRDGKNVYRVFKFNEETKKRIKELDED